MELPVYNLAGEVVGQAELSESVFGLPMNEGVVHQAIVRHLASQRVGNANTLTRGQVAGGGKKPWKQKGTGRARQGHPTAPHWRGGGVVFGPHPRDYSQDMPIKMRRLALRCALSQRVREDGFRLVEDLNLDTPKTKQATAMLQALNVERGALVVTADLNRNVYLSTRNIPNTATTFVGQLNIHDVMLHRIVVMPVDAARRLEQKLEPTAKSEDPLEA